MFLAFSFSAFWFLARGEQVTDAQDFGWQSKREDHFRSWFPFFSCFLGDKSLLFRSRLVWRPFCIFLLFSSDPWSGIFFLFCVSAFSHSLIGNFLPLLCFCFLLFFDWEFSLFASSHFFDWEVPFSLFSSEGKVYGKLGFWLKACSTAGHDICQGSVRFKDKRECPTLFPWHKCNNDDSEILCKTRHACTYADTQVSKNFGHVLLGLIIHFLYFSQPSVSKICSFINLRIHPSPFWVFEKLPQHLPFRCIHFFFSKTPMISEFVQRKVGSYLFSQACYFLARQLFIFIISFFLLFLFLLALFPLSSFFFFLFSLFLSEKVVRTRAHTTYSHLTTRWTRNTRKWQVAKMVMKQLRAIMPKISNRNEQ